MKLNNSRVPLDSLDWIAIDGYFLLLAGIVVWVITRKQSNTEDYFLTGRNVGWFVVGASIFASNDGSEHVVGLARTGAGDKLPMLIYEIQAWVVLILGGVFLPFSERSGVFTMPELLGGIWIPIMANISGVLYEYLQSVQSYIAPPITAVFLPGIFYKRINALGAFVTFVVGLIVEAARIILELIKEDLDPNSFLYTVGNSGS